MIGNISLLLGGGEPITFFILEAITMTENAVGRPLSTRRRKRLLDSKVMDIPYEDLHKMHMTDCRLRNVSEITIKGITLLILTSRSMQVKTLW